MGATRLSLLQRNRLTLISRVLTDHGQNWPHLKYRIIRHGHNWVKNLNLKWSFRTVRVKFKRVIGYNDELNWNDANQVCVLQKSNLASIHSTYSNRKVKQIFTDLNSENVGIWIGFTYYGGMGGYQWTDRSEFSYTNWAKDEPSGSYDGTGNKK